MDASGNVVSDFARSRSSSRANLLYSPKEIVRKTFRSNSITAESTLFSSNSSSSSVTSATSVNSTGSASVGAGEAFNNNKGSPQPQPFLSPKSQERKTYAQVAKDLGTGNSYSHSNTGTWVVGTHPIIVKLPTSINVGVYKKLYTLCVLLCLDLSNSTKFTNLATRTQSNNSLLQVLITRAMRVQVEVSNLAIMMVIVVIQGGKEINSHLCSATIYPPSMEHV